jgi:hypothetical protein
MLNRRKCSLARPLVNKRLAFFQILQLCFQGIHIWDAVTEINDEYSAILASADDLSVITLRAKHPTGRPTLKINPWAFVCTFAIPNLDTEIVAAGYNAVVGAVKVK